MSQQRLQKENRKNDILNMEECFRILYVDKKQDQIFVPATVQFKIKNFTDINFDNLSAVVNGVLCISFLIFTYRPSLETMLLERLYWNPQEQQILVENRRKRVTRADNYVPVMFNKDFNVRVPTTRTQQYQIQCFKSKIHYRKNGLDIEGWRIYHVVRKQFKIQIIKSSPFAQFFAPFNFINLELSMTLDHMNVRLFDYQKPENIQRQNKYTKNIAEMVQNPKSQDELVIRKINFNLLRIEDPYRHHKLSSQQKIHLLAPMLSSTNQQPYGKYDIAQNYLNAFTFDQVVDLREGQAEIQRIFEDKLPTQKEFKQFKYATFQIPLFRYPIVDMMTIFVPLWLLSFISIYIFYQTTQIMFRIMNVAGLMIAYATVQPIVRLNLPDATGLTLIDTLIYGELLINILFLARSIQIRNYFDDDTLTNDLTITNANYDRWADPLFIASVVITLFNFFLVVVMIIVYLFRKNGYRVPKFTRQSYSISQKQNWTNKLLMERSFARYKNQLHCFDDLKDLKELKNQ